MSCGIYVITNCINNKRYVGSSRNIESRWYQHKWNLNNKIHDNMHLQNSFNLHGMDKFSFEIIELCDISELSYKEESWMNKLHAEYNIIKFAAGRAIMSEETKEKLRKANSGRKHSEEAKLKISLRLKGKKQSESFSLKLAERNRGKILSEETKLKMSKSHTGLIKSKESTIKMLNTKKSKGIRNGNWPGEKNPLAILKNADVLEIVSLRNKGALVKDIALTFRVSPLTISSICTGRSWSTVTGIPKKSRSKK